VKKYRWRRRFRRLLVGNTWAVDAPHMALVPGLQTRLAPPEAYCFFSGAGAAAAGLAAGLVFQKSGLESIICWEG
jgi:hypothetical protein